MKELFLGIDGGGTKTAVCVIDKDICPTCGSVLGKPQYCPNCGQALDWSK